MDPYMGSGSTGVACAQLGRHFVGMEIDEGYFEIACDRIRDAYRQSDIFGCIRPEIQEALPLHQTSLFGDGEP
ncbi:DNA methyltransferase [Rhizobium sp. N324]|uniref:DNA methyltransferase n=1 Tax=Rhizobium sp. N324 TaxID=1703969 RepID=UPI0009ED5633